MQQLLKARSGRTSVPQVFVNDAFGSWQPHVSTYHVAKMLPSCAGLLMQKEVDALSALTTPVRPFLAVIAGSKLDTKMGCIKAIAEISFTRRRPRSSWERTLPSEYGFYANVNPEVAHPRWSQARERPIGAGVFAGKKPTMMFNGYADQVASLYDGLDLRKNF